MKTTFVPKLIAVGLSLLAISSSVAQKNKFLEGKKFSVNFYEIKSTGRGKAVTSFVTFKSGKIQSDLMEEKIQLPPAIYKVSLDTTYTEDDTEMHLIELEADFSQDKNDYKWQAKILNFDIEGTVLQSKNGVEKKKYEFDGSEKTKK